MAGSKRRFYTLCPAVLAATLYPLTLPAQPALAPTTQSAVIPAAAPTTQPVAAGGGPASRASATQGFIEIRTPSTSRRATTQLTMNFKDASIDAVLEYLSEAAGFIIVKETPVEGRVTLLSSQFVDSAEAVSLLNTVLKTPGYTAIRQGRVLKITTIDKAKKMNVPVTIGGEYKDIPETDEIITHIIPVSKVDAVKLKQDLQPLIGTNADLTANAASNTVVITDTAVNVRRVVQIISSMDKNDPTVVDIKVVQLKYADATSLATLITNVFKVDDQAGGQGRGGNNNPFQQLIQQRFGGGAPGGGGGGGGRGGGGGGAAGGGGEEGAKAAKIVAAADARTNTIVITGPAETLKVIDSVIKQLDSDPTSNQTIFTYNLKNGQATTLEPVLNALFGSTSGGTSSGTARRTGTTSSGTSAFGGGSTGLGGGSGRTGGGGSSFGGGGTSSFGGGTAGRTGGGGTFGGGTTGTFGGGFGGGTGFGGTGGNRGGQSAASELSGQVFVVANADTNSLLVTATTKYVDQVKRIIEDLDRPVPQVLIKVLIAEVTHDNSEDLGVDFSALNKNGAGRGVTVGSTLGAAAAATGGGLVVSIVERDLSATLRAIATAGKLDVLSRPYILASDNQEAKITVGQEVPFITDTRTDALGQQINTITYQDIGIILDVIPHINPEGLVIMDVAPEISQLTGTTVPISSNVSAPVFAKRSAETRVAIQDGQTIVIGGLMQDNKTSTLTKVPFLGDIPGLGLLFQRKQITKSKTELLIFITPHVAHQPTALQTMSQDEMKGTKLTPNAVEPGTFDDHLRGLQRGTTRPSNDPLPPPLVEPRH